MSVPYCRAPSLAGLLLVSALAVFPSLLAGSDNGAAAGDALRESIRLRIEQLIFGYGTTIVGEAVPTATLLAKVYGNSHRPLWRDRERIEQLWDVAALAEAQGLDPGDYPLGAIRALLPPIGLTRTRGAPPGASTGPC
jgi:hypothetical protein